MFEVAFATNFLALTTSDFFIVIMDRKAINADDNLSSAHCFSDDVSPNIPSNRVIDISLSTIKKINAEYLEEISTLEQISFPNRWSKNTLHSALDNQNNFSFGLFIEDKLVSVVLAALILDEVNIINVMTSPEFKQRGYAKKLLQTVIAEARTLNVNSFFLEVRQSNLPALRTYKSVGFKELSIRKDYYQSPLEDAIVMSLHTTER